MRILVLSDSHSDKASLRMAIESEREAEAVIFLGDGLDDFNAAAECLRNKKIAAVKGNCDSIFSPEPDYTVELLAGKTLYCTHGYKERVKFGLENLTQRAKSFDADIVLYGHTHIPYAGYDDGLYILNPGSVRENSCGIIDITPSGIFCFVKKIVQ